MSIKVQDRDPNEIHKSVREHYASEVESRSARSSCGCGSTSSGCCGGNNTHRADTGRLYEDPGVNELPDEVIEVSLGCGDPVTLASLTPGQTVLDLGSGGGIDCFLAAKKVGPTGHVIGVDMTPQMIDKARANQEKVELDNVEFRLGEIEHLPVADNSVDVVISNCVINLSPDKPQVFGEIFRVLKPGGKMAVSDIVTDGELPEDIKKDLSAWAGCVAGAWQAKNYVEAIRAAGFVNVELTPVYFDDSMIQEAAGQIDPIKARDIDIKSLRKTIFSAKIKADKLI